MARPIACPCTRFAQGRGRQSVDKRRQACPQRHWRRVRGPCHVQGAFFSRPGAHVRLSPERRQIEARRHRLDRRGGGGARAQVPGVLGDGQRRALFRRAREHRQPGHGTDRALCHPHRRPARRPPARIRPPQGGVLLGGAGGRADRGRLAADLPRGLRRLPAAAHADRADAGAAHQRRRHRPQCRLVVVPADLGTSAALTGPGRRRAAPADRRRDLDRRDRRPGAGDRHRLAGAGPGARGPRRRSISCTPAGGWCGSR